MSSRFFSVLYRFISGFIAICLLSADIAGAASLIDFPQQEPIGSPISVVVPPAEEQALFRTTVSLRQPRDLQRLLDMGVVVLESDEDSALVLVTSVMLADLARLRFAPAESDELGTLLRANRAERLLAELSPALEQAAAISSQAPVVRDQLAPATDAPAAAAELAELLAAITPSQQEAIGTLAATDSDNDGLTDTQEGWWCTDPANANSDNLGPNDGAEVNALKAWLANETSGYPTSGKPFVGWPKSIVGCQDDDRDSVPDVAEEMDLGLDPGRESTDFDKFDDGQELFGITDCCTDTGLLPRSEDAITNNMPSWVEPPGKHPMVASFPEPEVTVVAGSWSVERVTTITTAEGTMSETSNSYATTVTEGQASGVANSVTWNSWEEVSTALERPLTGQMIEPQYAQAVGRVLLGAAKVVKPFAKQIGQKGVQIIEKWGPTAVKWVASNLAWEVIDQKLGISEKIDEFINRDTVQKDGERQNKPPLNYCTEAQPQSMVAASIANSCLSSGQDANLSTAISGDGRPFDGQNYSINDQEQLLARSIYDISVALNQPRITETKTNGHSWGGAQTTTHEQYEEHSITNGQQFTSGQNWSTAWAVDSAHAANLRFTFRVDNTGTEYFRELTNLIINIYLGDDETPIVSYEAWRKFTGGKIENFYPADPARQYGSDAIELTLEQMKRIDMGEKLTIVVEDFSYGADEGFYNNAINGGVEVLIEDGAADNDETVDRYVVPTWGVESVQDVLTRAFPATEDAQGNLIALKTPEFNGTQPPVWNEYALSDIAWWNVYQSCSADCANVGATPLHEQNAQAGSSILFRFNRDSDRDGYKDNVEWRYGTDRNDPADHPFPEMLAGYTLTRSGNQVTGLLKLLNNGSFDAYGIDAVIYAPDDSITITNNTVGGNGRVRAGESVAVGSLIQPPDLSNWGSNTVRVYAQGNYTGNLDRVYTFTVQNAGVVGAGNASMTWSDGAGNNGVLQLGSTYQTPLPLPVANGLEVGLDSGTLLAGTSFSVQTLTPRDTFKFTINTPGNYTPPVVVVSYSDPQGSHRFITPVQLGSLEDDLNAHSGQMVPDIGLSISANSPFNASGANTTDFVLYSPDAKTIEGAKLYLDFVSDGKLVKEFVQTFNQETGPTMRTATWSTADFNNDYNPNGDNILLAFWTDAQDNIIDSAARPFDTLQDDPTAVLVLDSADLTWDFDTAAQGAIVKKSITIGNTGRSILYVRPASETGLSMSPAALAVQPGDFASAELILDTLALPVGPYSASVALRTSDPAQPSVQMNISGTVNATPNGVVAFSDDPYRPWDRAIHFANAQAAGVATPFAHTITTDSGRVTPLFYQDASGTRLGDGRDIAEWAGTTTELVQNGGFETGGAHFWSTGSGSWSIVTDQMHSGNYSANATQQNNQASYFYQDIDLTNWQTWIEQGYGRATWSNWVKSGLQAGKVTLTYFGADGSEIASNASDWLLTGNIWQSYTSTAPIPPDATRAQVRTTAQPATGDTGWIELINNSNNGGFETGNMSSWNTDGTTYDIGTTKPHSGSYHVKGTTAGNYHYFYRDAGVSSTYYSLLDAGYGSVSFSAWVLPDTDETIRVELRYQMSNGTWTTAYDTGNLGPMGLTLPYHQITYQAPIPAGVRTIRPVFTTKRLSSGSYTGVNVDDVALSIRFSGNPVASDTYFDDISFKLAPQYAAETKSDDSTATVLTSPDAIAAGGSRRMQYGLKQQYPVAGDQTFTVRLPDHPYSSVKLDALLRDPVGNPAATAIAIDVGANGSIDWQASGLPVFPNVVTTDELASAVSAYMAAQPAGPDGMVDVPIKVTLGNGGTLFLTNLRAAAGSPDGAIANADVSIAQTNLTEGDTTTINATVRSAGAAPLEDVTVAFYATLPNGLEWYLGSRYLQSVSPSGTALSLDWDTTGFTGNTTVKVRIDPYNSLGESNENNNLGSKSVTINTRPNLLPAAITPATFAPIAGQALTVDVTFQNNGQTPSAAATCSLYLGNPDDGGTLIGSQACGPLGANTSIILTYNWTPGAVGPARLFARADSGQVLDEPDEFDNDRWLDLDVADPGPLPPNAPSNPDPANNATGVAVTTNLAWTGGDPNPGNTVTYKVYMDTFNPPTTLKITQSATSYDPPGDLAQGTTYYWKIVATDNTNRTTDGPVWSFTTYSPVNNPPNAPANPNPADGATGVAVTTGLSWTGSDPENDPLTYEVRFGTANPPPQVVAGQGTTSYDPPGNLANATTYYWQIVAKDAAHPGGTPGPVWSFTTASPPASPLLYVTPTKSGTVGGITVTPQDILSRDGTTGTWAMYFKGSNVGVTKPIQAFAFLPGGDILLVFKANQSTPAGTFTPWDVVRFHPTATGTNTAGTFSWYFDGSDVGLSTSAEKIDALDALADGRLLISTAGSLSVLNPSGGTFKAQDEDLVSFTGTFGEATTVASWGIYLDGTAVPGMKAEDLSGAHVDEATGDVYATILGSFNIGGVGGNDKDVIKLHPSGGGTYTVTMYWRGSLNGFNLNIGGFEMQ